MTNKQQQLAAATATTVGIVMVVAGAPFGGLVFVAGLLWFAALRILH